MTATDMAKWTEVYVKGIARSPGEEGKDLSERSLVMILAERDGERTLPIWIGPTEAGPGAGAGVRRDAAPVPLQAGGRPGRGEPAGGQSAESGESAG